MMLGCTVLMPFRALAEPPPQFNLLAVPVDFTEEPGMYDYETARANWADRLDPTREPAAPPPPDRLR